MVQNDTQTEQDPFSAAKDEITSRLEHEKTSAAEAIHDARDQVTEKASQYASEAKDALFEKAEGTQRDISSNLSAFGGALRAASEHLANADQKTASKFVLDAAGGLESLSGSLKNKPFEDVLGDLRSFGNNNAGALIAGSVLAGLALGRFLKSSSIPSTGSSPDTGEASRGERSYGADTGSNSEPEFETPFRDQEVGSPIITNPANDWPAEPTSPTSDWPTEPAR